MVCAAVLTELDVSKFCEVGSYRFLECEFGCDDMLVRASWLIAL